MSCVVVTLSCAGVACARTVPLEPTDVPRVIDEYRQAGRASVRDGQRTVVVDASMRPEVEVEAAACRVSESAPRETTRCPQPLRAPLDDVLARGDRIELSALASVSTSDLVSGSLTFEDPRPVDVPRHRFGVQAGGTAFLQFAYRARLLGPFHLDVGAFGAPEGALNGSLGGLFEVPVTGRWALYAGLGGGVATVFAPRDQPGCDPDRNPDCPLVAGSYVRSWVYGRAGASLFLGMERRDVLGLDVGVWRGSWTEQVDSKEIGRGEFVWPMAGVSYLRGL
jgi:hypothetical protein